MNLFSTFSISGSALTAEKFRVDLVASNLANMHTTRTPAGGPYQRRTAVFAEVLRRAGMDRELPGFAGRGVRVHAVVADRNPPRLVYDPDHPDAGPAGYVEYPNIEMAKEITDLITAQRSYEANSTVINTAKSIYLKALEIGR